MPSEKPETRYSAHLDTLVALVTNLAMTKWKSRTPTILAKELALDHDEVAYVLQNFKGLFRETYSRASYGEPYYWLQLRWARRHIEKATESDQDPVLEEPLEAEYLSALLNFILTMVEQEQASEREQAAGRTTLVSSWIAAGVVILGVIVNLILAFTQLS